MTQMKDIGVLARVYLCVCLSVCVCAHNLGNLCRRKSCDEVVSLRWSHSSTSMSLAVQLTLHKEIALLFEVDVTVGAHKASRVTIFVSSFHHCPTAAQKTRGEDVHLYTVKEIIFSKLIVVRFTEL